MNNEYVQDSNNTNTTVEKTNTKWIIVIIAIIVAIGVIVVGAILYTDSNKILEPSIQVITNNQNKTENLTKDETIYTLSLSSNNNDGYTVTVINSNTQEEEVISTNAKSADLSPNNKSVAYVTINTTEEIPSTEINIYDISSKKSTIFLENQPFVVEALWSPDGKYLLLESGTYLIRSFTLAEYSTKKTKQLFRGSEIHDQSPYYWIDSENIVFMSSSEVPDAVHKPAGTGLLTEINKVNILTGEEIKLAIPDIGFEYIFNSKAPVNGQIEIKRVTYDGPYKILESKLFNLNLEDGTLSPI